jgi:hypothetical protein
MPKEKSINVVTRAGTVVSLPESEAKEAIARGDVSRESSQSRIVRKARHEEKVRHTNTEDKIQAFGEGILGSLSLGGTDLLFGEDAGKRARHNKGARVIGELLGLGGGIAGGSGKNLLRFTPAGALFGTARKAGQKFGGSSLAGQFAVEGLVEGAGFGAGQTFSNAGLYDDPVTAEKLLANVTTSSLIGGGIGGLFGGGAQFFRKEAAEAAENVNPWFNPKGEAPVQWGAAWDDGVNSLGDEVFDAVRAAQKAEPPPSRFVDPAEEFGPGGALTDATGRVERVLAEHGESLESIAGGFKTAGRVDVPTTPGKGQIVDDPALAATGQAGPRGLSRGAPVKPERPVFGEIGAPRAQPARGTKKARIAGREDRLAQEALDEFQFGKTQELPRGIDDVAEEAGEVVAAHRVRIPGEVQSFRGLVEDFSKAQAALRKATGGKGRAFNLDKAVRRGPQEAIRAAEGIDQFSKALGRVDDALGTEFAAKFANMNPTLANILPPNAGVILSRLGSMDAAELAVAAGVDAKAVAALGSEAREYLGVYALGRAGVSGTAKAQTKMFEKWVRKAEKNAGKFKDPVLRGSVGMALAAPFVYSPVFMAYRMAAVAGGIGKRISKAIGRFLTTGKKAPVLRKTAIAAASSAAVTESKPLFDTPSAPKGTPPIKQRMADVAKAASNPEHTESLVNDMLIPLKAQNLDLGFRMTDMVLNRIAYLAEKLPKSPALSPLIESRWEPSATEMGKWARYFESAEDPVGRLEKEMARGLISVEMVETLKAIYPSIYVEIQQSVLEQSEELRGKLPYAKRIALSTLFEVPLDPAADTQFGRTMQGTHAQAEQGPQPQGIPTSPTALRENVLNTQTKGQKLTER